LGELGLAASNTAPALVQALEGQDEAVRDKILEAIGRVNPNLQIERIDARTIANAVINAEISLGDRGDNFNDPVTAFIMDKRKFSSWWTRPEVVSVATKLAKLDPQAYAAFAEKVLESYPELRPEMPVLGK
jgi:hypothetical protein